MLNLKGIELYRALIETANGLVVEYDCIRLVLLEDMIKVEFVKSGKSVSTQTFQKLRLGDTITMDKIYGTIHVLLSDKEAEAGWMLPQDLVRT